MNESVQRRLLFAVLALMVAVLALVFRRQPEPPPRSDYYTGPMASKSMPGVFVMPDGRVVPPPPGWHPPKIKIHPRSSDL
jgi:hypothetical protein